MERYARGGPPGRWGLYDPETEHDACGVGFVANIRGKRSRRIVAEGLEVLRRLSHRAATGADPLTGDGAGIMVQLPHQFFAREGARLGYDMPRRRRYAVGQVFLPRDPVARRAITSIFAQVTAEEGQRLLGWRDVPVDEAHLGPSARTVMPDIRQVYIACRRLPPSAFEPKLFVIRKRVENRVRALGLDPDRRFHVASLSAETIVYKGLLLPEQLPRFFPDLGDPDFVSAIALVHSRFSTNTFPTWDLAQPLRFVAHNGEINTVQGNRNWMRARRSQLQSPRFWGKLEALHPIVVPGKSDSAQFDNLLELLVLGGRSLPQALMMMIPEAWENDHLMSEERRAYYEYAANLMEPWDGPAAMAFTDGRLVGATLDRNGLRPCRYVITDDDRVVLASETGVLDIPPNRVRVRGRLRPGRMLLVDTEEGVILDDGDVKREIVRRWPYRRWLDKNVVPLSEVTGGTAHLPLRGAELRRVQRAFGYTDEDRRVVLGPMAATGKEPIGSMGHDAPLAVLSDRDPSLFNYFHQLFAQVTNPPIDPIREELVMSLRTFTGAGANPFGEMPEQCHALAIDGPMLTHADMAKVRSVREGIFEPTTLALLFPVREGAGGLARAVDRLCTRAAEAVAQGYNILVLSDRGVDAEHAPIPILLAVSAVHQHLVREGIRMQAGLVAETGEAREVHHFALLLGYGASTVNPYLALDTLRSTLPSRAPAEGEEDDARSGDPSSALAAAERNYIRAIERGLLKIMSKMGISTLHAYRGAQIFEAVGLEPSLLEQHFTGTRSRIGGIGLERLGAEVLARHARGFGPGADADPVPLPVGGDYQWRRRGERHKWNPATIAKLQAATRAEDHDTATARFEEFSALVDAEEDAPVTLRGLLAIDGRGRTPVPLDEVEPARDICRRFVTGAMSFGSISPEAHETLAIAMNRIGGRSNSGEGGEEARRYRPDPNGDRRDSAIKQVASARFGVHIDYLNHAVDLQIKVSQGAKPGEGGQLPGHKVDERIAAVRCATPGVTLISPPPHHDIYSIEDLKQLIFDLKCANPRARVSVKLVSELGVGTVAAGVVKAGADAVVIAGMAGGTGASPLSSIQRAGMPWEMGLAETQQVLMQNDLRGRVRLQADGGFRTGRDVVVAALLGAEEYGFATAALVVEGCVMLRKCHLNTCSVGIATQDPGLRRLFTGDPDHVVRYFELVAEQVRRELARLGLRRLDEAIGRTEWLRRRELRHAKAAMLDLEPLLARYGRPPRTAKEATEEVPRRFVASVADPGLAAHLDRRLWEAARSAVEEGTPTEIASTVQNTQRAVGTMLSGWVARVHEARGAGGGLPEDTLRLRLRGSAGQSLGAFLASGITIDLEGDANDYVGKGLSGGRIVVRPPAGSRLVTNENVIVGNVCLYGATGGAAFFAGQAGERFAVRNSGAQAVVEGVGDHGCEYMTGGVVVVLGHCGWNFAAGMSGGMAFVFDPDNELSRRINGDMVTLEPFFEAADQWLVQGLIEDHVRHTGSPHARRICDQWETMIPHFVKVMPTEYRRVLERRGAAGTAPSDPEPSRLRAVGGG
ncbi:MAG: glutamate synthase large subunit [Myxococcota bacterium]